jgi:hypothetical protein
MNGNKAACMILVMIIAGIVYCTQIMAQKTSAISLEATNAESDCVMAESASKSAGIKLENTKFNTEDLRQFLIKWRPVIERIRTGQEAENQLMSILRNSGILTISQKFEIKDNKTNLFMPKTLQGTLVLQDEYAKTLNWLGELERKIPIIRVNTCRLKQGENGRQLNLEIRFDIPIFNLDAEFEEPKKS